MESRDCFSAAAILAMFFGLGLTCGHPRPAGAQLGDLTKKLGLGTQSSLPDAKIASGLKNALQVGTDKTVNLTGRPGG